MRPGVTLMAIIVQGCTVVVKSAAIAERFPGGLEAFVGECPKCCSDESLTAVVFRTKEEATRFTERLASYGFSNPLLGASSEVAIAVDRGGGDFLGSCDWLRLHRGRIPLDAGGDVEALIGFLADEWPGIRAHPGDPTFTRLLRELGELEKMPVSRERDARLAAVNDECRRLVEATGATDPAWLQMQGFAARLAGRWKVAEQAIRRLTELRPDLALGWMDLTWVLAHEDRLEEAEAAAREAVKLEPNNPHAHGNLANVLNQQGKIESALQAVTRAMALDPANEAYRIMRQRLLRDVSEKPQEPQADSAVTSENPPAPWYKRLLRRS
jgi:tetratricopeptide (TPR) repeat protein